MRRSITNRGIAIGPILMMVALIGIIAAALSSGMGSFSVNTTTDRIRADVRAQVNLIRSKIQECYMITMGNQNFGWPASAAAPGGTLVGDVECPGDPPGQQNIWSGRRAQSLPPTPQGFNAWVYLNYSGGRCIRLTPLTPNQTNSTFQQGLQSVMRNFSANEAHLDTGGDYSLSIWLEPRTTTIRCGS